jgi:hypothetical protein
VGEAIASNINTGNNDKVPIIKYNGRKTAVERDNETNVEVFSFIFSYNLCTRTKETVIPTRTEVPPISVMRLVKNLLQKTSDLSRDLTGFLNIEKYRPQHEERGLERIVV